jgi:UDP-N-acetyl-2-amino-2-deoxyglucuronate dehydrogenase
MFGRGLGWYWPSEGVLLSDRATHGKGTMSKTYTAAIIGSRGMGAGHATGMNASGRFEIAATCDIVQETAAKLAAQFPGAEAFTDAKAMLADVKPEVVVIATPTASHAALTFAAVAAGARGIYCEKPMAVNLADARKMVQECRDKGIALCVNHQRRQWPLFQTMRKLIADGAIGNVQLILGSNAGDFLSDGTHFVDTARYLAGDPQVSWVLGQVYRNPPAPASTTPAPGKQVWTGERYGHPVESGGIAIIQFANGIRAEVHHGEARMEGDRWYQSYEIIGSKGRMFRANDSVNGFLIQDEQAGGYRPYPLDLTEHDTHMQRIFTGFAEMIDRGETVTGHPLAGESALADQEIIMAIYESARTRERVTLPLQQGQYPLDLMIEDGEL